MARSRVLHRKYTRHWLSLSMGAIGGLLFGDALNLTWVGTGVAFVVVASYFYLLTWFLWDVKNRPGDSKGERLQRAAAARQRWDWSTEVAELRQALADYGPDAHVLSLLAVAENGLYQRCLGRDEGKAETYLTAALQHIHEAIALEPTNSRYYCDLGFILMITEVPRTQESLDVYRRAIEVDPLDWYPLYTVTCFFAYHPDADLGVREAICYGERALQIRPTRHLWNTMAELYESAGDLAASERAKQAALTALQE